MFFYHFVSFSNKIYKKLIFSILVIRMPNKIMLLDTLYLTAKSIYISTESGRCYYNNIHTKIKKSNCYITP